MPIDDENEYRHDADDEVRDEAMEDGESVEDEGLDDGPPPLGHPRLDRLESPPRSVPMLAALTLRLGGGGVGMFGWIFFGFGMVFVWAFGTNVDYTGWARTWTPARGEILSVEELNMSVNDKTVYKYQIRYTPESGAPIEQVSYRAGVPRRLSGLIEKAEGNDGEAYVLPVPQPTAIEISGGEIRLKGGSTAMLPIFAAFVYIFPAVGLACILGGAAGAGKRLRLLREGVGASGVLIAEEPTSTTINNRRVYKYTFEFAAADGSLHQVTCRTHRHETVEDDDYEPVLYDPQNPASAAVLDAMPMKMRLNDYGQWRVPITSLGRILIPLAILGGHGAYALHQFGVL